MMEALAVIACLAAPGDAVGTHWSWYTVDGRRCWFAGRPRSVPRERLRWQEPLPLASATSPEVPKVEWELEHRWPDYERR